MDSQKELVIEPARWSKDAADVLEKAIPYGCANDLRLQCEAGAKLFEVFGDGESVGFYLLRIDRDSRGYEGVVVAAAGRLPGVELIDALLPYVERQFTGCYSMRLHTARTGLARKMARHGYGSPEIVLRKKM